MQEFQVSADMKSIYQSDLPYTVIVEFCNPIENFKIAPPKYLYVLMGLSMCAQLGLCIEILMSFITPPKI